jgi:aspartyl-tRNA(Asn)/glutamyl-tRNA(Gln) amidotransferase subunit C
MALTNEEVLHIAKLARLQIDPEELDTYRDQLVAILGYVAKLQEVDTTGAAEAVRGVFDTNVFRKDEIEGCGPDVRGRIIEAFPRRQGDLLEVQAVFSTEGGSASGGQDRDE